MTLALLPVAPAGDALVAPPTSVRMLELTGDAWLDRLHRAADGSLVVSVNRGQGVFHRVQQELPVVSFVDALVSDLDGDGLLDVYFVSEGDNAAFLGDGTGHLREATEWLGLSDAGEGVSAERVDLDGRAPDELLLHNRAGDVVFWARNGTFERDRSTPKMAERQADHVLALLVEAAMAHGADALAPGDQLHVTLGLPEGGAPRMTVRRERIDGAGASDASAPAHTNHAVGDGSASIGGPGGIAGGTPPAHGATSEGLLTSDQQELLSYMRLVQIDDGFGNMLDTIRIEGANLQIVNGLGATNGNTANPWTTQENITPTNGLGNLIVGYNEILGSGNRRGSHNVVVGQSNSYTRYGGLIAGHNNTLNGAYASAPGGQRSLVAADFATVSGGSDHQAWGDGSAITGGFANRTYGEFASVTGGEENRAEGDKSAVTGGGRNLATGTASSVTGGDDNEASALLAAVTGGSGNVAGGETSCISAGWLNETQGQHAWVGGGRRNTASGSWSGVAGGEVNVASGVGAMVTGGFENEASGNTASVSGGQDNVASAWGASVVAGRFNTASGAWAAVVGGGDDPVDVTDSGNVASARLSVVGGGEGNTASGDHSVVAGGGSNLASGSRASVTGGQFNIAGPDKSGNAGDFAAVTGGKNNRASGNFSSVTGGGSHAGTIDGNLASGELSSVTGGGANAAIHSGATVTGGQFNMAIRRFSAVTGGYKNQAGGTDGDYSTVTGGYFCDAYGNYSSVSGGYKRTVGGVFDWRGGSIHEDN